MAASKAAKYDALAADGFGHWLAGFIDGEGCFYMRLGDVSRKGKRTALDIRMTVGLRADERPIIEEILARTGLGRISMNKAHGRRNPEVRWNVSKHSELMGLIEILDEFPLRAKKRRDYAIWRGATLAYLALGRKSGAGAAGFDPAPFEQAVVDLRAVRAYEEAA
jgi:hypothetical protein